VRLKGNVTVSDRAEARPRDRAPTRPAPTTASAKARSRKIATELHTAAGAARSGGCGRARTRRRYRALCAADSDDDCAGPTAGQARWRTEAGKWPRAGGLTLITVGVLGPLVDVIRICGVRGGHPAERGSPSPVPG
jgi:hypothetical protein